LKNKQPVHLLASEVQVERESSRRAAAESGEVKERKVEFLDNNPPPKKRAGRSVTGSEISCFYYTIIETYEALRGFFLNLFLWPN